jgi:hypothetical protein
MGLLLFDFIGRFAFVLYVGEEGLLFYDCNAKLYGTVKNERVSSHTKN